MTQVLLLHALETVPTIATCRKRADTKTAPRAWLPLVPAEDNRCVSVARICHMYCFV
jgi:hypothetical protein